MKEITIKVPDNCELKQDGNTYTIVEKEKKPAEWSEEDEKIIKGIIDDIQGRLEDYPIEQLAEIYFKEISWLKSLKDRIQPQQEWSREDEINRGLLYNALNKIYDIENNVALSNWINKRILLGSKQEWSEEDKMQLDATIHLVSSTGHIETTNWLKNLKDRVQLQPKQEWSEEEKARIDKIIDVLDWAEEKGHIHHSDWENYVCYVKSLKPQNTWKPSKEQIIALRWVLNNIPYCKHKEEISGLLDQIKNL